MMTASRRLAFFAAAAAALSSLQGCNAYLPQDGGPSPLAQRPNHQFGPSNQRLDEDGYPLLGAFPGQAAQQLDSRAVAADTSQLSTAANQQNAQVRSAAAEYRQSLTEAQAIRAQHRADVTAITAVEVQRNAARRSNDEVLRQIEGR